VMKFVHGLIQYLVNMIVFGIIAAALCTVLILRVVHGKKNARLDRDALAATNASVRET
jgi:hypothetical protein